MPIIKKLSREVIEKIAAGEVVERPASVVKELVENAIDAGARSILVDVCEGGLAKIFVSDDGCGMGARDLALAVVRHATSKIETDDDLMSISTLGFRGEALAAIGAVSKLRIESKPNDESILEGARVEVAGGTVTGPQVAGCAAGTSVLVSDLFYNVPARKKFLKKPVIEYGHIAEVVTGLALANPLVRFDIVSDGKKKASYLPVKNTSDVVTQVERVVSILGEEYRDKLVYINEGAGDISLKGFVSMRAVGSSKDFYVFLNGRPVRDKMLMHAVATAFTDGDSRVFPAAVLWLDIDPASVDVNVHPTKREVRFAKSQAVHEFVKAAVRKGVACNVLSSTSDCITTSLRGEERRSNPVQPSNFTGSPRRPEGLLAMTKLGMIESQLSTFPPLPLVPCPLSLALRPIGQLGLTYIVCEDKDGSLVVIDQHAAHERLGFDKLNKQYLEGSIQRQMLIPERIDLRPKEFGYVSELMDALAKAGFEIELFGGTTVLVKAVPALLGDTSLKTFFEKLGEEFEEVGSCQSIDGAVEKIFAVVACHSVIRAGKTLSIEEMRELVKDIEQNSVERCPHGRLAVSRVSLSEVEKWFNRRI